MLHYVLGPAKSGKSRWVNQQLHRLSQDPNRKLLLLVPEQFTFETEKELFRSLGSEQFKRVNVTSFTHLAQEAFRQYGGIAGQYADDAAKTVLMELALDEVKDMLDVYAASAKGKNFGADMLRMASELKNANITPEQLTDAAGQLGEGYLKQKLQETAYILSTYDSLLARAYLDPLDDLSRAVKLLENTSFFQGVEVYLDEFKGFTAAEYAFLRLMLQRAENVTLSLCLDWKRAQNNSLSVFSSVLSVYERCNRMARECGIPIASPLHLEDTHFASPDLVHMERNLFASRIEPAPEKSGDVSVLLCRNEYDEADCTAAKISSLLREEGYFYNDIAVISRDLDTYLPKLEAAFQKYGISYFADRPAPAADQPLFRFVKHVLDCAGRGMQSETLLAMLKCGMTPFSAPAIAELENYLYVWDIPASRLREPFTQNPRGFQETATQEDEALLSRLNEMRSFLADRFQRFRDRAEGETAGNIAAALFAFLEEMGVRETVEKQIEEAYQREDYTEAQECGRSWDMLMRLLDTIAAAGGEKRMRLSRFAALYTQVVAVCDMGTLPQAVDTVIVGSADRIRIGEKRAVFVLGVNENVLPHLPTDSGMFTERERKQLLQLELELSKTAQEKLHEERFIAYKTLTAPTERLYLSARKADIAGESKMPSVLLAQLRKMFGDAVSSDSAALDGAFFCETAAASFSYLASHYNEDTAFHASLRTLLGRDPFYSAKLKGLERALEDRSFSLEDHENAVRLFGKEMNISPTRVESFYQCPFRYFLEQGIRAFPLKKADLDPLETGTLIHKILCDIMTEMNLKVDYDREKARSYICAELDDYIETVMGGAESKSGRFLYLYQRLEESILKIVDQLHAELSQSGFSPFACEYEIAPEADVTPLLLRGEDGTEIHVAGKIDRIDVYTKKDGEKVIRIVDYKSGKKVFKLNDVLYGLNLQMLIYLQCISQNGRGEFADALPAGILYMPAGEQPPALGRNATLEEAAAAKQKSYGMNGLLIEDREVLDAMEPGLQGIFIPVSCNKDGSISKTSRDSLVSLTELARINRYINRLIIHMANELHAGHIAACPLEGYCSYCHYQGVCGITPTSQIKEYQSYNRDAALQAMAESEESGRED